MSTTLNTYHGGNPYNQDQGSSLKTKFGNYLIIADGNGLNGVGGGIDYGSLAAQIATSFVTHQLEAMTEIPSKEFLIKLFKDANEEIGRAFDVKAGVGQHKTLRAGCTLTVIGQLPDRRVIVAYVGDSPAGVITQKNGELARCISLIDGYQHSPDNLDEALRVIAAGCPLDEIFYELSNGTMLPIYVETAEGIKKKELTEGQRALLKPCDIYLTPASRVKRHLNMTRSLANFNAPGITSEPTVKVYEPLPDEAIAIWAGSDGLSDTTPKWAICNAILRPDVIGSDEGASEALFRTGIEFGHKKFGPIMDNLVVGVIFDSIPFHSIDEVVGAKMRRIETLEGEGATLKAENDGLRAELAAFKAPSASSSSGYAGGGAGGGSSGKKRLRSAPE